MCIAVEFGVLKTFLMIFSGEKKVNSAALRKAVKEARQAEIERAREVQGGYTKFKCY